jgi:transposase
LGHRRIFRLPDAAGGLPQLWRDHNYLTLVYQLDQGFKRLLYVRKVRAEEARQMHRDGYESVLKNSRWSILKRRSNLTTNQTVKLRELLKYNLRTVKAYLMREDSHRFWTYTSPGWASKFLREWCTRAGQSRIEPMQLNWFESQGLSSGVVEGFHNKAKWTVRKAYGFKDVETISIALYHQLGNLPEPKRTHKFC